MKHTAFNPTRRAFSAAALALPWAVRAQQAALAATVKIDISQMRASLRVAECAEICDRAVKA
jgi:hypothetical protein